MADEADVANDHLEQEEEMRELARKKRIESEKDAVSLEFCARCDGPIPEGRRNVILGCTTCITCQSFLE
jgi:phage/conjugal plasmid C-4 type zinc finger TraR family protein